MKNLQELLCQLLCPVIVKMLDGGTLFCFSAFTRRFLLTGLDFINGSAIKVSLRSIFMNLLSVLIFIGY